MRFIRDIIAERSDGTPNPDTPEAEEIKSSEASDAPETPVAERTSKYSDRTMTRLSGNFAMDEDDVLKRLTQDEDANSDASVEALQQALRAHDDDSTDEGEEESNLFGDLDLDDAAQTDAKPAAKKTNAKDDRGTSFDDPSALLLEGGMIPPAKDKPTDLPKTEPMHGTAFTGVAGRSAQSGEDASDEAATVVAVPAPASGRAGRAAGRVKTRLLGFGTPDAPMRDPFQEAAKSDAPGSAAQPTGFPVGWLVVTDGPGRGTSFALQNGVSQIGRGADQAIRLDFGDTSISRSNHAAVAYDVEQGGFYLGHGGKANMVRLNDRPVLSTEELKTGDMIRIGETAMRFVAFCDEAFSWNEDGAQAHAS